MYQRAATTFTFVLILVMIVIHSYFVPPSSSSLPTQLRPVDDNIKKCLNTRAFDDLMKMKPFVTIVMADNNVKVDCRKKKTADFVGPTDVPDCFRNIRDFVEADSKHDFVYHKLQDEDDDVTHVALVGSNYVPQKNEPLVEWIYDKIDTYGHKLFITDNGVEIYNIKDKCSKLVKDINQLS